MPEEKENIEQVVGATVPTSDESIEITVNKSTKEISLKDPATGRLVTLKANVIEEEDDDEPFRPLTPDEFRGALKRLSDLGLTWTADRIPRVVAKDPEEEDAFLSDEFKQLQKTYPNLPRELSAVVYHALTGSPTYERLVGSEEGLKEKISAVRDLLLTSAYRSEFFFKVCAQGPLF